MAMAMDYNALKVPELKALLKQRGIPSTGLTRKQQIIDRLVVEDGKGAGGDDEVVSETVGVEAEEEVAAREALGLEGEDGEGEEVAVKEARGVEDMEGAEEETRHVKEGTVEGERVEKAGAEDAPGMALDATDSESRKRKRRSPAPPVRDESVAKKLKAETEDAMELSEDVAVAETAAAPIEPTKEDVSAVEENVEKEAKILPEQNKADMMPEENKAEIMADEEMAETKAADEENVKNKAELMPEENKAAIMPEENKAELMPEENKADIMPEENKAEIMPEIMPEEKTAEKMPEDKTEAKPEAQNKTQLTPSLHPPTRAIYIRNLVRPVHSTALRTHILTLASAPDAAITTFHLDKLCSHAFVLFTSLDTSTRARDKLHNSIFQDVGVVPKPLWVDYIPESRIQEWIQTELDTGGRRSSTARRWEVAYVVPAASDSAAPELELRHHEASINNLAQPLGGPKASMLGAPTGPRGTLHQPSQLPSAPALKSTAPISAAATSPAAPSTDPAPTSSASFTALDATFPHTTSKPKLYYAPASQALVAQRLAALTRATSRAWGTRRPARHDPRLDAMMRYTFEDGQRVVQGGRDFVGGGRGADTYRGVGYRGRGRGGGGYRGGRGRRY